MKRILIVDDDFAYSFELEHLFQNDYKVEKSVDGLSALGKINAEPYDCIILDVDILGAVDGFQVLSEVKNQERLKKIPIVVLTNTGPQRKQEFLGAGANEYLVKGEVSLSEIKAIVDKCVTSFHSTTTVN